MSSCAAGFYRLAAGAAIIAWAFGSARAQSPLTNNVPVGNQSAPEGEWVQFYFDVPSGQCQVEFETWGGEGDGDLYVRRGAPPTFEEWDWDSESPGNVEYIRVSNPPAGRYYLAFYAWEAFSGATIRAKHGCTGVVPTMVSPNPTASGLFGIVVAGVPDVNGDGKQDIAVGALKEGTSQSGRVYLFNGANAGYLRTINAPVADATGFFGAWIAGVPDVNGDGRGDVVIGAPGASPGASPNRSGRAYVYSGATGAYLRQLVSPTPELDGFFGASVAGLADVNGDGRGDIAVGATGEDPGAAPTDTGRVHVYSGATGVRIRTIGSPGPLANEYFGLSLGVVPDINGDGRNDLVVGAPRGFPQVPGAPSVGVGATSSGRAFVYSGASGQLLRTLKSPWHASEPVGYFGISVAGVPDANGDGKGDVLVGAPWEDPGSSPNNAGRAYLYSGATGAVIRAFGSPTPQGDGFFGISICGVPDATGDGLGDVVVGCLNEDAAGISNAGRVHVFRGSAGSLFKTHISPHREIAGYFGAWVAGLSDTNGNGRGEVVAGAFAESPNVTDAAGRAYLLRH